MQRPPLALRASAGKLATFDAPPLPLTAVPPPPPATRRRPPPRHRRPGPPPLCHLLPPRRWSLVPDGLRLSTGAEVAMGPPYEGCSTTGQAMARFVGQWFGEVGAGVEPGAP